MDSYPFNHSARSAEIERLELMHHNLIIPIMGKTLLPADLDDRLQGLTKEREEAVHDRGEDGTAVPLVSVADICTGTGVWLIDMAKTLAPSARLDGYDFDTSKFPPATDRPQNVDLVFGDVLKPFPSHLHGQYDLVHTRLLIFALGAKDWKTAAENMIQLLRPGGYLVWEDCDLYNARAEYPGTAMEKKLGRVTFSRRYFDTSGQATTAATDPTTVSINDPDPSKFPVGLDKLFSLTGLSSTEQTMHAASTYSDDPNIVKTMHAVYYTSMLSLFTAVAQTGGFEDIQTVEDAEANANQAKAEMDAGVGWSDFHMLRTIGRKPL